ncbi:UNKNOWN [Stylonychia lemnae]|uniref:Uncharacterized protein n=1 Tax=Stylonychia lemnae TaxID=5949 RepID=A0A077ZZJ5_STYLE|nr:UNKNOWN [Stylonychia lemnae]|eukprot:CDW75341.1 UNKNOWN [Stylonychia lemnae]
MESGSQLSHQISADQGGNTQFSSQIYEQKLSLLNSKLEVISNERHEFASQFSQQQKQISALQNEKSDLFQRLNKKEQELKVAQELLEQQTLKSEQLINAKSDVESNRAQLQESLNQTREQSRKDSEELKQQIHQLMKDKSTVEFERATLKLKISSLELQNNLIKQEKDKMTEQVKLIQEELSSTKSVNDKNELKLRNHQQKIDSLEREVQFHNQQVNEIKRQSQTRVDELYKQINDLIKDLEYHKSINDQSGLKKLQFQTQIASVQSELDSHKHNNSKLEQDLAKLKSDYECCKQNREILLKNKDDLIKELQEVKEKFKIITVMKSHEDIKKEVDQKQILKYHDDFKKILAQQKQYPQQTEKLIMNNNQLANQIQEYQRMIAQYKLAYEQVSSELDNQLSNRKNTLDQYSQLENHYVDTKKALASRTTAMFEIQAHYDCLWLSIKESGYEGLISKRYDQYVLNRNMSNEFKDIPQLSDLSNKNLLLQTKLDNLQKENQKLLSQNQDANQELDSKDDKISQLEEVIQKLQHNSNDHIQPQVNSSFIQVSQLEILQRNYTEDLNQKINELAELRMKLHVTEQKLQQNEDSQSLQNQIPKFNIKDYVHKNEFNDIEEGLYEKQRELNRLENQLAQSKGEIEKINNGSKLNQAIIKQLKEQIENLNQQLEQEKQQLQNLKRLQIEQSSVQNQVGLQGQSYDQQFRILTEVIQELKQEKEKLIHQVRSKEQTIVMNENQSHSQSIIIENLKLQLKTEQDKNIELQKVGDYIRRNPDQNLNNQDSHRNLALHAQDKNFQAINDELRILLITQKEENEKEIENREQLIQQAHQLIIENEQQVRDQQELFERRISELTEKHIYEAQSLNTLVVELQRQNAELNLLKEDLQTQLDAFTDQKEKLLITDEMQNSEIKRLHSSNVDLMRENSSSNLNPNLFKDMSERVDNLQISFAEKEKDFQIEINQLKINLQAYKQTKDMLLDEIDSLKENENLLKNELSQLRKHLDTYQQTNISMQMDQVPEKDHHQIKMDIQEQAGELIIRERLSKAENEVENLRGQLHKMNEKNRHLQTQINKLEFQLQKQNEQMEEVNQRGIHQSYQLRMLDEVNTLNATLQQEKAELQQQIEKINAEKEESQGEQDQIQQEPVIEQVAVIDAQEKIDLVDKLKQLQFKNEELRREIGRIQGENLGNAPAYTQQDMFKKMHMTLQKSRQIFQAVIDQFGMDESLDTGASMEANEINEFGAGTLGKRKRTQ